MTSARSARPPTLRDVATEVGVSMMTVSNVINERTTRVSEETRARILGTIEALGYRPLRSGRSLKLQREYAIGLTLVHPDRRFLDDPYYTEVAAGMSNVLADAGYGLMINGVQDIEALRRTVARAANVDALAVITSGKRPARQEIYRMLARLHHPLAVIQDEAADIADTCSFIQDDEAGGRAMARAVIEAGARTIHFAATTHPWPAVERREAGVREAAGRRARVVRITCDEASFQATIADVEAAFDRLGVPDAVIGANDQIGIAAMHAARRRGLRVPDDMVITGFNAFPFRTFAEPLVTSVSSPAYAIGEAVAKALLHRVETGAFAQRRCVLPVTEAPGASVRALAPRRLPPRGATP